MKIVLPSKCISTNEGNPQFYKDIRKKLKQLHYIIMDGDFNIAMDKNFDSMNYKNF